MCLWHEKLIKELPGQQLLEQHAECCALRGKEWNNKQNTANYVFMHAPYKLFQYHTKVMEEVKQRGYEVDPLWGDPLYRGESGEPFRKDDMKQVKLTTPIYPEHDTAYLRECLLRLAEKNIRL